MAQSPGTRLTEFVAQSGLSFGAAASRLQIDRAHLWRLRHGSRRPSRRLAFAIERLTADWAEGPIRAAEWHPALPETEELG